MHYHLKLITFFFKVFFLITIVLTLFFHLNMSVTHAQSQKKEDKLEFSTPPFVPINQKSAHRQVFALNKYRMGLKSWQELGPSLETALAYSKAMPQAQNAVEHTHLPWSRVTASLELLKSLLPKLDKNPELLSKHFQWIKISPSSHFTSYYSPVIEASRVKNDNYRYPLYRLPNELAPHLAHCLATHTCPDTAFTKVIRPDPPYLTREEIDLDNALAGRGLEIAWLKHQLDVYSLMLQGSGYLDFGNGEGRAILFAALNGHRGESMAGYLIRTKNIAKKDATMEGIKTWWDENPNKRRDFLKATTGYVFFRYGAVEPQGTTGGPLVPWVSLAVDPRTLPLGGILAYYLPTKGKTKAGVPANPNNYLQGLGFAHDTGGAIKKLRIDLYAGKGNTAHTAAMSVYNKGQIWLLLKKN